jgi:hypothetical protein
MQGRSSNPFLVASLSNLVRENSWAYRLGGQADDLAARDEHYARQADWHACAIKIEN